MPLGFKQWLFCTFKWVPTYGFCDFYPHIRSFKHRMLSRAVLFVTWLLYLIYAVSLFPSQKGAGLLLLNYVVPSIYCSLHWYISFEPRGASFYNHFSTQKVGVFCSSFSVYPCLTLFCFFLLIHSHTITSLSTATLRDHRSMQRRCNMF